jgi:ribosomal-protein-alanine N-acetyltransferase
MLELNFKPFPVLTTNRLVMRRATTGDAPALFPMRSDPEVMRYISRPLAKTVADVVKLINIIDDQLNANKGITWAITLKDDDALIGTIGFWNIAAEHHRGEIGYLLSPTYQAKGIMHEALTAVLAYGFEVLKLHSAEAIVQPDNRASINLLEKHGFIREGYFKENYYFEGRFSDSAVYSLLTTI